jgi:predicted trehalose synthase
VRPWPASRRLSQRKQPGRPLCPTGKLPRSYDYVAYYPEVVGIFSVLASPYWRQMAGSGATDDTLRFYHQVAANVRSTDLSR